VPSQLCSWFGEEARHPLEYLEKDWAGDAWARGAPITVYPPGVLTTCCTPVACSLGPIHWASGDTSARFQGWVLQSHLMASCALHVCVAVWIGVVGSLALFSHGEQRST
jgi:hypothetical protein